jgi:hypothetical protein
VEECRTIKNDELTRPQVKASTQQSIIKTMTMQTTTAEEDGFYKDPTEEVHLVVVYK